MDNTWIPNPADIDSWEKLLAFIFQVVFVLGVPILLARNNKALKENTATTNNTHTTLTEKNGGSTVKDTLDEIVTVLYETKTEVQDVAVRVTELENNDSVTAVNKP